MIYRIYKAQNKINGKCYIGFSKHTLTVRKNQHVAQARWKSKHGLPHSYFAKALISYGPENFEWETLYESKEREHCLNDMEDHFIRMFDAYDNGYNLQHGGSANVGRPGERNGMFGKTHSEETKASLSAQAKARNTTGESNPMFGKPRDDLSARNKLPKKWITKESIDKQILTAELNEYLVAGWVVGRSSQRRQKKPRVNCPTCGTQTPSPSHKFCSRVCANNR